MKCHVALLFAPVLLVGCAATTTPSLSSSATTSMSVPATLSAIPSGTTLSEAPGLTSASPGPSSTDPIDVNSGSPFVAIDCLTGHVTPGTTAPQGPQLGGVWAKIRPGQAPVMTVKEAAPNAASVATLDLVQGTGAVVKPTDTVTMDYCGVGLATRTAFDSSWVHGGAFPVPLAKVIPGWRDAIAGMKVGGSRLMLIPADKAFGSKPPKGSGISPDETIAFMVTVQSTGS